MDTKPKNGKTPLVKFKDTERGLSFYHEILPDKRNQYARLKSKKAKSRFLTHLQEVYGFERKYLIKLLTGERTYHPHPGRGCTYGPEFARYALKLHEACKYLCAPYFRVRLPTLIKDWEAMGQSRPTSKISF